jgi:hypothetical protein
MLDFHVAALLAVTARAVMASEARPSSFLGIYKARWMMIFCTSLVPS